MKEPIELNEFGEQPVEDRMEYDDTTFMTPSTEPYEEELWSRQGTGDQTESIRQGVRDTQATLNVLFEGEFNPTYGDDSRYQFDNTRVMFDEDGVINGVDFVGKRVARLVDGKLVFAFEVFGAFSASGHESGR